MESSSKVQEQVVAPRGRPKSGRVWKAVQTQRSSALRRDKKLHSNWDEKQRLRHEKAALKAMLSEQKELIQARKDEQRQKRKDRAERKLENERKGEVVQAIRNTAKLKRMKKKQLRQLQKRDPAKSICSVEFYPTNPPMPHAVSNAPSIYTTVADFAAALSSQLHPHPSAVAAAQAQYRSHLQNAAINNALLQEHYQRSLFHAMAQHRAVSAGPSCVLLRPPVIAVNHHPHHGPLPHHTLPSSSSSGPLTHHHSLPSSSSLRSQSSFSYPQPVRFTQHQTTSVAVPPSTTTTQNAVSVITSVPATTTAQEQRVTPSKNHVPSILRRRTPLSSAAKASSCASPCRSFAGSDSPCPSPSPRKRPRKQILVTTTTSGAQSSIGCSQQPSTSKGAADASKDDEWARRERMDLSNDYTISWQPKKDHFLRYQDVKPRERAKPVPTVQSIDARLTGCRFELIWKSLTELHQNETDNSEHLSKLLSRCFQGTSSSSNSTAASSARDLHETCQQRSRQLATQLEGAASQLSSILQHRERVTAVLRRLAPPSSAGKSSRRSRRVNNDRHGVL